MIVWLQVGAMFNLMSMLFCSLALNSNVEQSKISNARNFLKLTSSPFGHGQMLRFNSFARTINLKLQYHIICQLCFVIMVFY